MERLTLTVCEHITTFSVLMLSANLLAGYDHGCVTVRTSLMYVELFTALGVLILTGRENSQNFTIGCGTAIEIV